MTHRFHYGGCWYPQQRQPSGGRLTGVRADPLVALARRRALVRSVDTGAVCWRSRQATGNR
jgi:hypothetical protein